ncbi:MAG: hypothetical protein D6795_07380 [Deltaproteobacteria bacterium]|nr:MAG: hypothetical protein D6795_07380 [Deltaproteobacteria bacterium]
MILVVAAVALFAALLMSGILIRLYRSGASRDDAAGMVLLQKHRGAAVAGNMPHVTVEPRPDGRLDLVVHNRGEAVIRLPGILLPLTPAQRAWVERVKRYLLEQGAVRDIVQTDVPIYLPAVEAPLPELGMGNTLGYGKETFILLRRTFFDRNDIEELGGKELRTLYHELAHAYLARRYGAAFGRLIAEAKDEEARKARMEELIEADEAFAWYAENVLADSWQYRQKAQEEPARRKRLAEIYRFKLAAHQESYPQALYFWEPHWDHPRLQPWHANR